MKRFILFPVLLVALSVAGCETTSTAPPAAVGDPYPAPFNDPQISVLSPSLRPWLFFQPAIILEDYRALMQVEVPVRNAAERQYIIEYRVLFYDENGLEQEPTMSWTKAVLNPKQTIRLKANAFDTRAKTFRLEVQWAG